MHELTRHPSEGVYPKPDRTLSVGRTANLENRPQVKITFKESSQPYDMVLSNQDVDDLVVLLRYYQKEVFGDQP